ncbi:MAG: phosphate ABC transporter permease subunit PstC [Thermoplasmata archaeon]
MPVREEEEARNRDDHLASRLPRRVALFRWLGGLVRGGTTAAALGILLLAGAIAGLLAEYSSASIRHFGLGFLTGSIWDLSTGVFGAGPAIVGTLLTSALALLLGVPVALGAALFTAEVAPRRWRAPLAYIVDLGAMVPSVVYGFWGLVVLVPFMATQVEPRLTRYTHGGGGLFSGHPLGESVLTAGVILAVMIIPTIAALSREALRAVPRERRDAALGLGATRWEATRMAVLGPAAPGILGAVILGLGRALGEAIAVVLVIGNEYRIPTSLFSPSTTIPSWIVNRFDSASGLGLSAMFELGLVLFAVSVAINVGARVFLSPSRDDQEPRTGFLYRWRSHRPRRELPRAGSSGVSVPLWWPRVLAARKGRLLVRRALNWALVALLAGAVIVAVYPLASVTRLAVDNGGGVITHPAFYTEPLPAQCLRNCSLGGIAPAIQGTLILVGLAAAIGIPIGVLAGIYLSEYGRNRFGRAVGILVDAMIGIPSLLVGVFVFAVLFRYDRADVYTIVAGGFALAILMIPIVARTTDTALRTVSTSVRESALALGFPRHRITVRIVLGSARSAIVTGCILALGRAAGETAALLFTVGWSSYGFAGWNQPVASLAPFIYESLTVAGTPNWVTDAWGAALLLLLIMLAVTLTARLTLRTEEATGAE